MKRKYYILQSALLISVLFFAYITVGASAASYSLIVDQAGVLDARDYTSLTDRAEEVSAQYSCDVVVVFVRGLSGSTSIMSYTDDFFDYNGYGYGESKDGVMLLVDVQGREYWISTSGFGIEAFTDAGQLYLKDLFVPHLSEGDWAGAAANFINGCERFLKQARNGQPYDIGNMPKNSFNPIALLGDLGLGFLLGGLPLNKAKKEMENVSLRRDAGDYIQGKAPQLTLKNDIFIGSDVVRVPIPHDTSDSHGGNSGGGSSVHIGSSGHTHGGSGGHF